MLNRKSTNKPLFFACPLTLKRVSSEFLEAQLRSSKGVFVFVFCFIQNITLNWPKIDLLEMVPLASSDSSKLK